jgi:drug/metabolite transporter (DMT)-like permease
MVKIVLIVLFILATGVSGPPLIKYGAMQEIERINSLLKGDLLSTFFILINPYIFFGLIMYFVSAVLWIVIYSKYDLSFVNPLLSINYVFAMVIGYYLFQEDLNAYRWAGAVLIMFGVGLITAKG